MREIRSSGSVEGVMGNHDSYSDSHLRRPAREPDCPWMTQTCAHCVLTSIGGNGQASTFYFPDTAMFG